MIVVVTYRVSGSVRTCGSLSQTYGHRIPRIWTRLIMPSGVPFSRWSTIVKVSSQLTNWNERLSRHDRKYRNRSSTRASVNGIVVWSDCLVWQPADTFSACSTDMRNVDFVYLFCLWVCFVRLFDVIKDRTVAIHHLLRLLSFARWRHFIFQHWFK